MLKGDLVYRKEEEDGRKGKELKRRKEKRTGQVIVQFSKEFESAFDTPLGQKQVNYCKEANAAFK